MRTHVFKLHVHVQARCLQQSSNGSINSSHCVVLQSTSTLTVEHNLFPRRSNIFLHKKDATSKSTLYHPIGNGQCERYNGIIWKGVQLALKSHNLQFSNWEMVLPSVLHSMRSLLSTATNNTPHERLFTFQRRSMCGMSLPSRLTTSDKVMLRRYLRHTKNLCIHSLP